MTRPIADRKGKKMAKKVAKKATRKVPVKVKSKYFLLRGYVATTDSRIIAPGESFTADEISADRLKELQEKGLVSNTLTTEEKGTITK
jgi:hypothetical protein